MSDRWRKKLGALDETGPSDDLFERAKQGPTRGHEPEPGPRTSTRIVTVVVAFLVFVLAISAFVIPALRMNGTTPGSESLGLFPIWPAQSSSDLEALQAQSVDWVRCPQGVAVRFGQEVMGWPDAIAQEIPASRCAEVANASASASPWMGCDDVAIGSLAPVPGGQFGYAPVSGPPSGYSTSNVGDAFVRYVVFRCACELGPVSEILTLYQPLEQGASQIWAVLEARAPDIDLSVAPGQTVRNGASISAGFNTAAAPILAYAACDFSGESTAFHGPAPDPTTGIGGKGIEMGVALPASDRCSGPMPGYVWAATAKSNPSGSDPIAGLPPDGLIGLTAVPIVAQFDETATLASETPTAVMRWTSYTDPFGWTIDVPAEWQKNVLSVAGGGTQGVQFIGDTMSIQVSTQTSVKGSPPPSFQAGIEDDSQFPLDTSALLSPSEGGLMGRFHGDGQEFMVLVLSPSLPDGLSRSDQDILDRIVGSISFAPWTVGDVRHDWVAIPTPSEDVSWVTVRGGLYMLFRTADGYRLYGSISCNGNDPSDTSTTANGFAVLDCPDGSSWQMNAGGESGGSGNAAATNDPPPEWPVVKAHDGTLIGWVLPGVFPPGTGASPSP